MQTAMTHPPSAIIHITSLPWTPLLLSLPTIICTTSLSPTPLPNPHHHLYPIAATNTATAPHTLPSHTQSHCHQHRYPHNMHTITLTNTSQSTRPIITWAKDNSKHLDCNALQEYGIIGGWHFFYFIFSLRFDTRICCNPPLPYTVECRYNAAQCCKILHKLFQELRQNINHMLDPQKTPQTLPWIDHLITALHCMCIYDQDHLWCNEKGDLTFPCY